MSNKFNLQDEIDRMKAYEAKTTMSNTPLPEPAKPLPMEKKIWYSAGQLHAHAAAVSAADNAAILRERHNMRIDYARASDMLLVLGDRIKVLEDALRVTERELQSCQSVIHLAGGFDPAYVLDAQAALKAARAALGDKNG